MILLASQVAAVTSIFARGLGRPHACVLLYLLVSLLQMTWLSTMDLFSPGYRAAWIRSQPVIYLLWLLVVGDCIARSFPRGLRVNALHLGALSLASVAGAGFVLTLPAEAPRLGVTVAIAPALAAALAAVLAVFEFLLRGLPCAPNVRIVRRLMLVHMSTVVVGSWATYHRITIPVLTLGAIVFNLGLAALLRRDGGREPAAE